MNIGEIVKLRKYVGLYLVVDRRGYTIDVIQLEPEEGREPIKIFGLQPDDIGAASNDYRITVMTWKFRELEKPGA